MDVCQMKNMVVLRNLPSNIVDEAFVVLKSNKKVKKLEKIDKAKNPQMERKDKKDKEYVLKEAEMLVADYIAKIEDREKSSTNKTIKSYTKLKKWAYISTAIAIIEGLLLFST